MIIKIHAMCMICSLKMLLMTKAPFMEKRYPDEKGQVRWPVYPSYPGRANFSYISLQNVANCWHETARSEVTLFGDVRVTLLARPTFLHKNTLTRPVGSIRPRRDNQSMRKRCWLLQCKRVSFFWGMTLSANVINSVDLFHWSHRLPCFF